MGNKQRMPIRAHYKELSYMGLLMGNKQRMPIRAEGPHVGTDPVSVRLSANSVYRPHNIFRPVASGGGQTRGLSLHAGLPPE